MERRYVILDVFCNQPFAGNPLAVVLNGGGLDDELMQKIAGEFNLSETVFVSSVDEKNSRAQIRIFTPLHELPFAGHPTVGTATLLAGEYFKSGSADGSIDLILDEQVGPVKCKVTLGENSSSAQFALPQLPEHVGECGSDELIAQALGYLLQILALRRTCLNNGLPVCPIVWYRLPVLMQFEKSHQIQPHGPMHLAKVIIIMRLSIAENVKTHHMHFMPECFGPAPGSGKMLLPGQRLLHLPGSL